MNRRVIFAAALAATTAVFGDTNETVTAEQIIGESIKVFQAEGWTAKDVADAIRSLRGLYVRDNADKEGRKRWHGKKVSESVDTNACTKTSVYEDGETFVDAYAVVTPSESVRASNAKLKTAVTNGIPVRLAQARLRRVQELNQVSNETVTVTAGRD